MRRVLEASWVASLVANWAFQVPVSLTAIR